MRVIGTVNNFSPTEKRFWARVDKNGPVHPTLKTRCWVWTGTVGDFGHGKIGIDGKNYHVHRYSYNLHIGPIPDGLCVLHKCDNPPCVNPSHLFLGTRIDNNLDRDLKDRQGDHKGLANGRAKITEEQVRLIRSLYRKGVSGRGLVSLSKQFGISPSAVRFIIIGKNWSHL